MAKIKNPLNYDYRDYPGQFNTQPSQTLPDQTMSIKTIMERYAKGLPIANALDPIYEDEENPSTGINPRTLDLVDLQDLKRKNQADLEYFTKLARTGSKKQRNNSEETTDEQSEESTNNS